MIEGISLGSEDEMYNDYLRLLILFLLYVIDIFHPQWNKHNQLWYSRADGDKRYMCE